LKNTTKKEKQQKIKTKEKQKGKNLAGPTPCLGCAAAHTGRPSRGKGLFRVRRGVLYSDLVGHCRTPRGGVLGQPNIFSLFVFSFYFSVSFSILFCFSKLEIFRNSKKIKLEEISKSEQISNWNKFLIRTNFKSEKISNRNEFQIKTNFKMRTKFQI
jgi:hypothetical protein